MWLSWILFLALTAIHGNKAVHPVPGVVKRDVGSETTPPTVHTTATAAATTATTTTLADSILSNIWYVSDYGSDENDCNTESAPCKNLQTVLDRATDGADIYVTSDTLSLDGNVSYLSYHRELTDLGRFGHFGSACTISSSKSYSIYNNNNTAITTTCSEEAIHWTVADRLGTSLSGIPSVNINNCGFSGFVLFTIYGLLNFDHCSFMPKIHLMLEVFRSDNEQEPTNDTVKTFHSTVEKSRIKIICSKIISSPLVFVNVYNAAREIQISHCELNGSFLIVANNRFTAACQLTGQECVTILNLQVEHTTFFDTKLHVESSSNSYVLVSMSSNRFYNGYVKILGSYGIVGFHVKDSIWHNDGSLMYLFQISYVNITNTQLKVLSPPICHWPPCSVITIKGLGFINTLAPQLFHINLQNIDLAYVHIDLALTTLFIKGVMFEGGGAPMYKRYFNFDQMNIIMVESSFIIEDSISIFTKRLYVENVEIQCPKPKFPRRVRVNDVIVYACGIPCTADGKYTLQSGNMTVSERTTLTKSAVTGSEKETATERGLSINTTELNCLSCPLGADCGNVIDALPNYWGYRDENDFVRMIRCPDGYCCTDNETCQGIDSCNTGRTGTLCGTCDQNLTEALFSPKCIPTESCLTKLVPTLYVLCALAYTVVFLTFGSIKTKFLDLLKTIYQTCRSQLNGRKPKLKEAYEMKDLETKEVSNTKRENSRNNQHGGMKYMQILFYYVQDATLFRVQLPGENESEVNVLVKIMGFSPELLFIYTKASDLCIASTTAVAKIFYQSAFGFVMMILIFLIYLGQKYVSTFVCKKLKFWVTLRAKLIQAFLLTVLFSYQKLVIGSFTLVQCVLVGDHKALYIQGDIECFTWWQIIVQVYICTNIVPILFVLSQAPFYVQDRKMSVKVFILACLFPLPVMILYHIARVWRGKNTSAKESRHSNIEEEQVSNVDESEMASEMLEVNAKGDRLETEDTVEHTEGEVEILYTLLKHYRTLKVFGIRFTWLGIHNMYRVMLVACNTYITDPLIRLYAMSAVLLVVGVANTVVKPYKTDKANITAVLSYAANGCIAFVNAAKTILAMFGCDTNCSFRNSFLWYLGKCEDVLLLYTPIVALGLWVIGTGLQKGCSKRKLFKGNL